MNNPQVESSSWSIPSSRRLPAVSVVQALRSSPTKGTISTSLEQLDEALSQEVEAGQDQPAKGISRGHVTEVFGPPGSGKTTLAMAVAASALKDGGRVTWIDTGSPVVGHRLKEMLSEPSSTPAENGASTSKSPGELLESLLYLRTGSLPHLLSLAVQPPPGFLSEGTTLLVVDCMAALFASAYPPAAALPKTEPDNPQPESLKDRRLQRPSRKWSVAEVMVSRLAGLAASKNIAILLTSHATTTSQLGDRLTLRPAMSAAAWDPYVRYRVALYRSWLPVECQEGPEAAQLWVTRFAEVVKKKGSSSSCVAHADAVPFIIETSGLKGLYKSPTATKYPGRGALNSHRKRKIDMITTDDYEEQIDDEYGWSDDDDALIDSLARPYDDDEEENFL